MDCSTFQTRSASESCRSLSASKIAIRLRSKIVDALTQHSIKGDRKREREREREGESADGSAAGPLFGHSSNLQISRGQHRRAVQHI